MALVKCPECGSDVSTRAEKCPHCDAPATVSKGAESSKTRRVSNLTTVLVALGIGLLLFLFLFLVFLNPYSRLENEAVKRAKEYWKLTQIGESTYLCAITTESNPSGFGAVETRASKKVTVCELRNIKVLVGLGQPSEVEKLNGVEYDGIVNLYAAACRRYSPRPHLGGQPDTTWSDWSGITADGHTGGCVDALEVRKSHGEWKVVQCHGQFHTSYYVPENATFEQVEASDLPK